jgi:predicted nucleotidyltransferase component of viral defense system
MEEPLAKRLKKPEFVALAGLQDRFVEMMYSFDSELVLHGGTAIWRCYGGNRFSYDIDGYIVSKKESKLLDEDLTWKLAAAGIRLNRIRNIGGSIFTYVGDGGVELKVEFLLSKKKIDPISVPYEKVDGTMLSVRTLTPEDFIIEKMGAYNSRQYARDLYDIYQLVNRIGEKGAVGARLRRFIKTIKPPLDETALKEVVLSGVVPSFEDMVNYIEGRLK